MSIIDIIAREIGERPDLRGVSAPVVRAVADLAITALFDRLDETVFRPGLESTSLDDLSMCECGTISPECVTGEDCTLCPGCVREAEKCPKSPTGKHVWAGFDIAVHALDETAVRCVHCEPASSEPKASGYLTDEMVEQARAFDASKAVTTVVGIEIFGLCLAVGWLPWSAGLLPCARRDGRTAALFFGRIMLAATWGDDTRTLAAWRCSKRTEPQTSDGVARDR